MNMKPDVRVVMKFTEVALAVLSARALVWVTMLIAAALFGYAIYTGDPLRLGIACAFTLLVFWRATAYENAEKPKGEARELSE